MADLKPASSTPSAAAFAMLHPAIQRQLWAMRWPSLRPLQVDSIRLVMGTDAPLLLSAATAAGKTEAAFLPVLSKIADEPAGSVRALYVGPLKALINDQFARVEDLCTHSDLPVHRWHGDVPAARKRQLVESPGGVLLITPESLESLFVNRSQHLRGMFGGLGFVVIDELHSFLGNERGLHLRSLLSRLATFTQAPPRMLGLSATIGDPAVAQRYLSPDEPNRVHLVSAPDAEKEWKLRIHAYRRRRLGREDDAPADGAGAVADQGDEGVSESDVAAATDIVRHCGNHANLVFANSRGDVEEYANLCTRLAAGQGLAVDYLVHHGSLSAEIRHDAEQTMKSGAAATTFCSSTLEMGIDIGSVRMVGQLGAPWSVASMKQRLGRSGRRENEPQIMRVYLQCTSPDHRSDVFDRLHVELLQAVAVTELMLDRWVEPSVPPECDLSTLAQQVISVISQTGGATAALLHQTLCVAGPFRDVNRPLFARLLRRLVAEDVIEQVQGGDLILGLRGERIRKDKGFYAVFPTPDEYGILHDGELLGSLHTAHEAGDHLLFAGRRWQVVAVDHERLIMQVKPAAGWKRPKFTGGPGEVHPRVRERMRQLLAETTVPTYLDEQAQATLAEAREAAAMSGAADRALISLGPRRTGWMTWTGTRIQDTLLAMIGVTSPTVRATDEVVGIVLDADRATVAEMIRLCGARNAETPERLAAGLAARPRRKYDDLLGDELSRISAAQGWIDLVGAHEVIVTSMQDRFSQGLPE